MELKIDGSLYEFFSGFDVTLSFDAIASKFNFFAFFDPANNDQKKLFLPLSGKSVELFHQDEFLFKGVILNTKFQKNQTWKTVNISGYSKSGVLEDCNIPTSVYPLESNNLSLVDIAKKLCKPFGISVVVDDSIASRANKSFKKTIAKESDTIKGYLARLAMERNLIITHTVDGDVFITKANTDQAVSWVYSATDDKVISINASINGQKMHSEITSIRQASIASENAGQATKNNIYVDSFRPAVKVQSSGSDSDTSDSAISFILSELKSINFAIEYQGFIHKPNEIISVKEPFIYLYNDTKLFIESVRIIGDNKQFKSQLTCVLPEIYSNSLPTKNVFL